LEILAYSEDNLAIALSNTYTSSSVVSNKNHFIYLKDYLGDKGLKAKTIVIENDYVSKDFLHDYASYYALCFENYPKVCKRVHFFNSEFSEQELINFILDIHNTELTSDYLGYIVVKPIPLTIIGNTILKTYPENISGPYKREFWGIRDYEIHLYGRKLIVKSLAFQEQDSVLAACATTAVWSMLNKAASDYRTILKTPSEITKDADNISHDGSRLFPNSGLNLLQICKSILNSGLVTEVKNPDYLIEDLDGNEELVVSNSYLKRVLNAYSLIGIPVILIISVPSGNDFGLHAVAVSGFKQKSPEHIDPTNEISWHAENIETIYVHDDQWGPFARVLFKEGYLLQTDWTIFDKQERPTTVVKIVVPVYPKIRISYEDIEALIIPIDLIFTLFFDNQIKSDLVWDVKIDYSENFKALLKTSSLSHEEKLIVLTRSLPKYIWVASCYIGEFKIIDFVFDATDVSNGMIGKDLICYLNQGLRIKLLNFLKANQSQLELAFINHKRLDYYKFIIDKLS